MLRSPRFGFVPSFLLCVRLTGVIIIPTLCSIALQCFKCLIHYSGQTGKLQQDMEDAQVKLLNGGANIEGLGCPVCQSLVHLWQSSREERGEPLPLDSGSIHGCGVEVQLQVVWCAGPVGWLRSDVR